MFRILYNDLIKNNCDISICNWYEEYDGHISRNKLIDNDFVVMYKNEAILELLKDSFKGFVCNKLFKRDILENIRFENKLTMCEDYLTTYKALTKSKKIVVNSKPLYYYVKHSESTTNSIDNEFNLKNHESSKIVFDIINQDIKNNNKELIKASNFTLARNSIITISQIKSISNINKDLIQYHRKNIMKNFKDLILGINGEYKYKLYGGIILISPNLFIRSYNMIQKIRLKLL